MENDLDEIADGRGEALPWLTRFYFGTDGRTNGSKDANGAKEPGGSNGNAGAPGELGGDTLRLGLKAAVALHLGEIDAREINSIPIGADSNGEQMVVRVGRYGPYLQRGEDRASLSEDVAPDELTETRAEELLDAPSDDRVLGTDPTTGSEVWVRAGRFGPYVQLGEVVDGQ